MSRPVNVDSQTLLDDAGGVVRFVQNPSHPFDPICLDTDALVKGGLIEGNASAGRGNTVFFTLHNDALVLRHYRRGGLVRHISKIHYVFTGLHRTRAMREFDLLMTLEEQGLPAPRPYACGVRRHGLFYTASLVTHRLPGQTLAERLLANGYLSPDRARDESLWRDIGELIARFHAAGVYHADLNAHNIMLDDDGNTALIDFDRGRLRTVPKQPAQNGWCLENMNRLERSLKKIVGSSSIPTLSMETIAEKIGVCREQWALFVASEPPV